jgi:hypothetical protein
METGSKGDRKTGRQVTEGRDLWKDRKEGDGRQMAKPIERLEGRN